MATFAGKILKVSRSKKGSNAWFSARLDCGDGKILRVVGFDQELAAEDRVEIHGELREDPRWGPEIKAKLINRLEVNSYASDLKPSIRKERSSKSPALLILSQGVVKGIGAVRAQKLIDSFGELGAIKAALKTLKKKPPFGRANELLKLGELMTFGLSQRQAEKAFKEFGVDVVQTLKRHPYLLIRIEGLGFKFADALASEVGIHPEDRGRCAAGINFIVDQAVKSGNTGIFRDQLLRESQNLLGLNGNEVLLEVLSGLEVSGRLGSKVIGAKLFSEDVVFDRRLFEREKFISDDILKRLKKKKTNNTDLLKQVKSIEKMFGFGLHVKQREAAERAGIEPVFILTGGPGTGKTTTVKAIYDLLRQQRLKVALTAPTGKAAQRLGQACDSRDAKTMHRLLEWHGQEDFKQNQDNPLDIDAVIVDEASMVDVNLMYGLLKALPEKAKIILVGDKDQLPSVSAGQVLHDLLESGRIPTVMLDRGFRQGVGSPIADSAIQVNTGQCPTSVPPEFEILWVEEGPGEEERAADKVLAALERLVSEGVNLRDIQILSPKREDGKSSSHVLSRRVQTLVNPASEKSLQVGPWVFRLGDRVINTQNNYSPEIMLANGDTGLVFDIDEVNQSLTIQVDGDRRVTLKEGPLQEIELAYALTVHKSQGSEFPVVIMPILSAHKVLLTRRLIYTGMTRARQKLILIAGSEAINHAVQAKTERPRVTALAHLLSTE